MIRKLLICAVTSLGIIGCAGVQPTPVTGEPITRKLLQKMEYPEGTVTQMMIINVAPNALVARHTHPGVEISYVLEGETEVVIDGKPPIVLKAGDSFAVLPGIPHGGRAGPNGAKLIGTFIVDKSKPLVSPIP